MKRKGKVIDDGRVSEACRVLDNTTFYHTLKKVGELIINVLIRNTKLVF